MNENIDVNAINKLISGKSSINIGIDLYSALLLIGGVFVAVLFAGILIKLITKNL